MTRVALALLRPLARTTPWLPLIAAAAVASVLPQLGDGRTSPVLVRLLACLLCAAAAFALDDPAAETVASSPTPLHVRRALRVLLVLPVVAAGWAALLWSASADGVLALTLELGALLATALALAAAFGAARAGPALLVLVGAAWLVLPESLDLFVPDPASPGWEAAHLRWALVLAGAAGMLAYASRDPARRRARAPG